MLHLIAQIDGEAYALEARRAVEVLPLVHLQPALGPDHLALFQRRGRLTLAIDLSRLIAGRAFEPRLSTRLLVVRRDGTDQVVGLVAESVTRTLHIAADAFEMTRQPGEPAFLGPTAVLPTGWVRRIELESLLEVALCGFDKAA